ncbi:hypothetical protein BD833_10616 [Blastococcus xanthinilyticus]|uniref:Uncharacterized protein n=1 Tax=Blastococcus xanthinilyticus TaxID=1564164 RepID=A0A5S5CYJ2_9ACTN|nr:hypothetical protein BD833_10616 [Blastococcus xanthinilyticus]
MERRRRRQPSCGDSRTTGTQLAESLLDLRNGQQSLVGVHVAAIGYTTRHNAGFIDVLQQCAHATAARYWGATPRRAVRVRFRRRYKVRVVMPCAAATFWSARRC